MKIDIRDPDPDTANFPNGAYTLPKGRLYIENSPLGLYGASRNGNQPRTYQWEYLIRYGLTDNLEFRLFSNGLTDQAGAGQATRHHRLLATGLRLQGEFLGREHPVPHPRHGARGLHSDDVRVAGVQRRARSPR